MFRFFIFCFIFLLSMSLHAITLPEANLKEFTVYQDSGGRTIVSTDLDPSLYNGPNCNDKYWYQLDGAMPDKMYSALLAAYMSNTKVQLGVHDTQCTSNGRPMIIFIKFSK